VSCHVLTLTLTLTSTLTPALTPALTLTRYMTAALFYDKEAEGLYGEGLVVANCLVVREQLDGRRVVLP
jgi:hypothetical protein